VAISLALGVQRLARRRALMRRMAAVETLGSTSVICTDKTGTLTRDEMTVRRIVVAGARIDVTGAGYAGEGAFLLDGRPLDVRGGRQGLPAVVRELLGTAVLASDATLHAHGDGLVLRGDPTEGAIVVAAAKAGLERDALDDAHPRVHEIPFTSESRRMTTVHAVAGGHLACAKGAPEVILAGCEAVRDPEGKVALDEPARARVLADATAMAEDALRVIAVARCDDADLDAAETGMTLLGLVGLIDPPRDEAAGAIEVCHEAGIRVVMITGDHPVTATAVARELGLLRGGRVVTGDELDALDDERLAREVEAIDVFARVAPEHKLRVVEALQRNGEVVAMTGDGVNDAPALKRADIGIAMGVTGTDVAREAAAMTLTDDDFATIVAAVEEGRGIFGNIKKYLMFLLSSNVGEIGLMAGAAAAGLPLPLTAVQILYVNLATDGLPALALAVDPPERDLMRRPPRDPSRGVFTRPVVTLMLVAGAWAAAVNLALFAALLAAGRPEAEATTIAFVALVLVQFWNAFNFRSDHLSALVRPFANRWLVRAIVWELALLLVVVYTPVLQDAFDTYPLALADWALVLGVSATIVPVIEAAKWAQRRGRLVSG
jgi:Ca2+-transporting ATPase